MLLMVSKQGWCHFEALECIFHLNLKKNSLRQSADSQSTKYSVSEHMVDLVVCENHSNLDSLFKQSVCNIFFFSYYGIGIPYLSLNALMTGLLFKAAHKIRKREKLDENFRKIQRSQFKTQVSIPTPNFELTEKELVQNQQQNLHNHNGGYVSQILHPVFTNSYKSQQDQFIHDIHPSSQQFQGHFNNYNAYVMPPDQTYTQSQMYY